MFQGKLPIVIAVVLALCAAVAAWMAIQKREADVAKNWRLTGIVVANEALREGTVLSYEVLSERQFPEQYATRSVVKPDKIGMVIGQKLLADLQPGDPLLWTHVQSTNAASRLSEVVRKKGRAFALDVSGSQQSVGGWVRPNDRVDILASYSDPETGDLAVSTVLQSVVVLATGDQSGQTPADQSGEPSRRYGTLTVLVSPEEAEILALAVGLGSIAVTLRNPEDLELEDDRGRATLPTLLTGQRPQGPPRRARPITVIRGVHADGER